MSSFSNRAEAIQRAKELYIAHQIVKLQKSLMTKQRKNRTLFLYQRRRLISPPMQGPPPPQATTEEDITSLPVGATQEKYDAYKINLATAIKNYTAQVLPWLYQLLKTAPLSTTAQFQLIYRHHANDFTRNGKAAFKELHQIMHHALSHIRDDTAEEIEERLKRKAERILAASREHQLEDQHQLWLDGEYNYPQEGGFPLPFWNDLPDNATKHNVLLTFEPLTDFFPHKPRPALITVISQNAGIQEFCNLLTDPWSPLEKRQLFAAIVEMHTEYSIWEIARGRADEEVGELRARAEYEGIKAELSIARPKRPSGGLPVNLTHEANSYSRSWDYL